MRHSETYISRRRTLRRYEQRKRARSIALALMIFIGTMAIITPYAKAPFSPAPLNLPTAHAAPKPEFRAEPVWTDDVIAGAIGVEGKGVAADKHGDDKRPIASIAKLITALALIEKHPLKNSQLGPSIPLTTADEKSYREYVGKNGAVVPVKAGGSITLYHALEAMLLPSANNIADTAAIWAFGSLKNYQDYANNMVRELGMHDTTIGEDASGFSPHTQSTAKDLFKLGEIVLRQPVLAKIVAEKEANLPGIGIVPNYNRLVVADGFTGLKPGNTDEAGGTMLFSTKYDIAGKPRQLIGVVLGTRSGKTPYNSVHSITDSTKKTLQR